MVALYLSAKTRNVKGQYSETKPILAALYTLICLGLVLAVSPSPSAIPNSIPNPIPDP